VTWIAPDVERSEDYPARRNEPEREMLRDWLDWHRATLLRKCAGLDASQLATRAVPPSNLSLLGLVRHMSDTERGWVRQTFRGEQIPDLYYRSDAPDADFEEADPAGAEEDFERYRAECRAVDAALEGAKLDDTFTFGEKTTSVRWMWRSSAAVLQGLARRWPWPGRGTASRCVVKAGVRSECAKSTPLEACSPRFGLETTAFNHLSNRLLLRSAAGWSTPASVRLQFSTHGHTAELLEARSIDEGNNSARIVLHVPRS